MTTGHLALGSNVGDRRGNLQGAVDRLRARGVDVVASSPLYDTEPVGEVLDQPEFLNACLRIRTRMGADELLAVCKAVERDLGRVTEGPGYVRHGPRVLDVDVLLLGDARHVSDRLTVPHPELHRRRFVLVPLLALDPDVVIPGVGPAQDALHALGRGQGVRVAGPPLAV